MQNWEMIYELATSMSKDDFINEVEKKPKADDTPIQRFVSYMEKYERQVLPSLLASHEVTPQKFVQIVINEIKKNEKLLKAFISNPSSMFASILVGAEIGLTPSDILGEFYLIPRNLKQEDNSYKLSVTPLIGYKGLVKLLLRNGDVENIEAHVVYNGDKFKVAYGLSPKLEHIPKFDVERNANNITHIYTVAHYKSGKHVFHVMTRDEIIAVQNISKYPNDLYFNDTKNPNRWMEKKCCLIQMSKLMDKDFYSTKAIEIDSRVEGGAMLTLDNDEVKLIEGAAVRPARFRNIYGTLNQLPND